MESSHIKGILCTFMNRAGLRMNLTVRTQRRCSVPQAPSLSRWVTGGRYRSQGRRVGKSSSSINSDPYAITQVRNCVFLSLAGVLIVCSRDQTARQVQATLCFGRRSIYKKIYYYHLPPPRSGRSLEHPLVALARIFGQAVDSI